MDGKRYHELQYQTLRQEIQDSLARSFQIMVGGAALIPVVVGITAHYSATPILMTLPMVVVVTALLYLNQWNSIMRCGRYIRMHIEPEVDGLAAGEGWEAWLEAVPDPKAGEVHNRRVDTYLVYAFYLLAGAYFFATTYIAATYAVRTYGIWGQVPTLGVYGTIGLAMAVIIIRRVPTNTTTSMERAMSAGHAGTAKDAPTGSGWDRAVHVAGSANPATIAIAVPNGDGSAVGATEKQETV